MLDKKSVILMANDPQVLKGLSLLLEDIGFQVFSTYHLYEIEQLINSGFDIPELLVLPFDIDNGQSGADLVHKLRKRLANNMPAILLCTENSLETNQLENENIWFFSDQTKPAILRKKIFQLLDHELIP